MPVIGFLDVAAGPAELAFRIEGFRRGLNETGFVEGRNVAFEFRWAEGHLDRLPALAADLVRRQVAVLVTQNLTTPAAKAATSTIPIVFVIGGDAVASGLVTSVSRPEGNVTGVSFTGALVIAKRLELLHELVPKPAVLGVLLNPRTPSFEVELQSVEPAARSIGREILTVQAASDREIDNAFSTLTRSGAGALLVGSGPFFAVQRRRLAALAIRHGLPTILTFARPSWPAA